MNWETFLGPAMVASGGIATAAIISRCSRFYRAELAEEAATRELSSNSATKSIPVVFVTSKGQKADKVWAQMQGGKGYVTKPYTADDIVEQLKAVG